MNSVPVDGFARVPQAGDVLHDGDELADGHAQALVVEDERRDDLPLQLGAVHGQRAQRHHQRRSLATAVLTRPSRTGRVAEALEAGVQVPEEGALPVEGGGRLGEELLDADRSREPRRET